MQYFKKRAKHRRLRGATPHPRSGAEAGSTPCLKGGSQEELPHFRGQGQQPRIPDCNGAGMAERSYPVSEVRSCNKRSYPVSEVRGSSWEEIPHAPSLRPGATGGRSYPTPLSPRPRAAVGRINRTTEARDSGREDQPHVQGAVAARAQEG